jgi:hypothetical protein
MVLYRQRKFENFSAIRNGNTEIIGALMQQISHPSIGISHGSGSSSSNKSAAQTDESASAQMEGLLKKKLLEIDRLREKKQVEDDKLSNVSDRIKALEGNSVLQVIISLFFRNTYSKSGVTP